jgi:uncharacterized membrane protein YfcA
LIEIATILVFAVLQSIFGIGILFFGTPTLIILGYPFVETLSIVLPASIAVSALQVWKGGPPARQWRRDFGIWCLVPLTAFLLAGFWWNWAIELELFIAITLFAYVLIRVSPRMRASLQRGVRVRPKIWLSLIGIVHGLSNLGGGLLAIFAANTFSDTATIRAHIAFCYLCFAALQLTALAVLAVDVMHIGQLGYAALAGAVFVILERRFFETISSPVFDRVFTVLIGGYSALIFLKLMGLFKVGNSI